MNKVKMVYLYLLIGAGLYLLTSYFIHHGVLRETSSNIVIKKGDDVIFDYLRGEMVLVGAVEEGRLTKKQMEAIVQGQLARIEIARAVADGGCPTSDLFPKNESEMLCEYIKKSDDAFNFVVASIKINSTPQ